ncbi:hypothetical protein NDA14_005374 [Ustilago hordei]|nr:hypothetical protein NDA14_005374 [Ustilago hordei]UTT96811.1 hypothetical protein NDA17_006854 [Ustilago hordei]
MLTNPPPPATASRSSSYYTSHDHPPLSPSHSSSSTSSSDSSSFSSSSPSSASEVEYKTTHHRRKGTALVISQPTLVNFVPTSDIQTAVSITADRIVIDTILPPTATLRSRYPLPCTSQIQHQVLKADQGSEDGFDERLLQEHKEQLYRTLQEKLTENYDPSGRIKEEIFETLTGVTRFPDPVGTNKSGKAAGKVGCPCICCEVGCSAPVQSLDSTSQVLRGLGSTTKVIEPTTATVEGQQLHSFLDMTETSTKKKRIGFLTLPRWFGRSRTRADLSSALQPELRATVLPAPAPALPEKVTQQIVPPVSEAKVTKSRSFVDIVRRRRDKHQAIAPAPTNTGMGRNGFGKGKARQSLDENSPRLPTRSSSQANLTSNLQRSTSYTSLAPGASAGRFSLDSSIEPHLRADTPRSMPTPPPRRSSKLYAIVSRKPVPPLNPYGSAALPRSTTSGAYLIGQIVEEEEEEVEGLGGVSRSRRQSALMSSYNPVVDDANLEMDAVESGGKGWGFRSLGAGGGRYSLDQMRLYGDDGRRRSAVGVAI